MNFIYVLYIKLNIYLFKIILNRIYNFLFQKLIYNLKYILVNYEY